MTQPAAVQQDMPGLELVQLDAPFVVDSVALERRTSVEITIPQCERSLRRLVKISDAVRYWQGDLMNLVDTLFHEEASQVIDHELMEEATAKQLMHVAQTVRPTTRAHAQSWDHARVVAYAKLEDDKQVEWLDRSRADDWSARKLATEIAQEQAGPGKTTMRWWLVVECSTEARRDKLAEELGPRGYTVKKQEKLTKVPKPKKAKKGPVTAKGKPAGRKMNTRRRPPK